MEYTDFQTRLAKLLAEITELPQDEAASALEVPPDTKMGDFAFPCFKLAKTMRKAPPVIAATLSSDERLTNADFIAEVCANGAYLNFFINKAVLAEATLKNAMAAGDNYGGGDIGNGKAIVIDYSSPNIAKPFHVGHLRSTVIGNALYNIYTHLGYKCVGINHLGDWGTQFGKLICAFKRWGNREEIEKNGIQSLMEIYVRFHDEAEKDDSLNDEARAWFVKMQDGDEEALSLWKWIYDISMKEFDRVYKKLSIKFDALTGESFYNDKMDAVVEELKQKKLLTESNGAMIVDLEDCNMPPCLIIRKDGGTLYATRDIAAALYRKKEYGFHKSLYLTALDQNLHFAQFFKVLEKMGYDFAGDLVHVPFGLVSLPEGKLSTRKGAVVLMDELLDEAIRKTREIIDERSDGLTEDEKAAVAEQVGIGAVVFNDLYNGRIKDVVFSWDKMLNFNGETAPYIQYTHARASSILRKASEAGVSVTENVDFSCLTDDTTIAVIKNIYFLPKRFLEAADKNEPSVISRQLVDLCQSFNKLYNEAPILKASENERDARLLLVLCVKNITRNMLRILGISAPEKM